MQYLKAILALLAWIPELWGDLKAAGAWIAERYESWKAQKQKEAVREGLDKAKREGDTRDLEKAFNPGAKADKPSDKLPGGLG